MTIEAIPLDDLPAVMGELNETRKRLGMEIYRLESQSGISASAYHAWKSLGARPSLCGLLAVAQALGFVILMRRDDGTETEVIGIRTIMAVLGAEVRARRWSLADCESASGISAATFSALIKNKRDARVPTIVAMAKTFKLTLVLRRKVQN